MIRARNLAVALRDKRASLKKLVDDTPIAGKGGSEASRGAVFPVLLLALLGVALGITIYVLCRNTTVTVIVTVVQLLGSYIALAIGAAKGAA
jgi:hypothetical protein